jgi:hypothetical protein
MPRRESLMRIRDYLAAANRIAPKTSIWERKLFRFPQQQW